MQAGILSQFEIVLDYQTRTLTLVRPYASGKSFVGRSVRKDGKPTVDGVVPGDGIVRIDGQAVYGWSRDRIFAALRGKPGERHILTIERSGRTLELAVPVTSF